MQEKAMNELGNITSEDEDMIAQKKRQHLINSAKKEIPVRSKRLENKLRNAADESEISIDQTPCQKELEDSIPAPENHPFNYGIPAHDSMYSQYSQSMGQNSFNFQPENTFNPQMSMMQHPQSTKSQPPMQNFEKFQNPQNTQNHPQMHPQASYPTYNASISQSYPSHPQNYPDPNLPSHPEPKYPQSYPESSRYAPSHLESTLSHYSQYPNPSQNPQYTQYPPHLGPFAHSEQVHNTFRTDSESLKFSNESPIKSFKSKCTFSKF